MKNKSNLIIVIIVIILAILLIWPVFKGPSKEVTVDENGQITASSTDDSMVVDETSQVMENGDKSQVTVDVTPVAKVDAGPMAVKAFFSNSKVSATSTSCSIVFSTTRVVARTSAVARTALLELFKGLTPAEASIGLATAINPGVKINSLMIESGMAKVDLSAELGQNVAGACRVAAIRAQIENTLKQFPSVRSVQISIAGKTEGILQP